LFGNILQGTAAHSDFVIGYLCRDAKPKQHGAKYSPGKKTDSTDYHLISLFIPWGTLSASVRPDRNHMYNFSHAKVVPATTEPLRSLTH
jgi:hypothetical protein